VNNLIGIIAAALCVISVISAICLSQTSQLSRSAVDCCSDAVQLAIYLAGTMALWGGLMRVAEKAGITRFFERLLSPVTKRIFKGCDEKTVRNICMNITANMLGIANAATPLGIAAVKGMAKSHSRYAMRNIAMLTVLNTASIQLIPTTVGALRAKYGAAEPFDVTAPIIAVSLISALCGCVVVYAVSMTNLKGKKNAIK
jgi:spore maturation protein A